MLGEKKERKHLSFRYFLSKYFPQFAPDQMLLKPGLAVLAPAQFHTDPICAIHTHAHTHTPASFAGARYPPGHPFVFLLWGYPGLPGLRDDLPLPPPWGGRRKGRSQPLWFLLLSLSDSSVSTDKVIVAHFRAVGHTCFAVCHLIVLRQGCVCVYVSKHITTCHSPRQSAPRPYYESPRSEHDGRVCILCVLLIYMASAPCWMSDFDSYIFFFVLFGQKSALEMVFACYKAGVWHPCVDVFWFQWHFWSHFYSKYSHINKYIIQKKV